MKAKKIQILVITSFICILPLSAYSIALNYDLNGSFTSGPLTGEDFSFSLSYNTDDITLNPSGFNEVVGYHSIQVLGNTYDGVETQFRLGDRVRSLAIDLAGGFGYLYEANLFFDAPVNPHASLPINTLNASSNMGLSIDGSSLSHGSFNTTSPVPEPATLLLLGTGLAGIAGVRFRKKKK